MLADEEAIRQLGGNEFDEFYRDRLFRSFDSELSPVRGILCLIGRPFFGRLFYWWIESRLPELDNDETLDFFRRTIRLDSDWLCCKFAAETAVSGIRSG